MKKPRFQNGNAAFMLPFIRYQVREERRFRPIRIFRFSCVGVRIRREGIQSARLPNENRPPPMPR